MLPEEACHVTALSDVEPRTVAVNGIVAPVVVDVLAGEINTELTAGPVGSGVGDTGVGAGMGAETAATITTAEADLVGSATLVAVTVPIAARAGAV